MGCDLFQWSAITGSDGFLLSKHSTQMKWTRQDDKNVFLSEDNGDLNLNIIIKAEQYVQNSNYLPQKVTACREYKAIN